MESATLTTLAGPRPLPRTAQEPAGRRASRVRNAASPHAPRFIGLYHQGASRCPSGKRSDARAIWMRWSQGSRPQGMWPLLHSAVTPGVKASKYDGALWEGAAESRVVEIVRRLATGWLQAGYRPVQCRDCARSGSGAELLQDVVDAPLNGARRAQL